MSLLDGVRTVLAAAGEALHSKVITQRLLERGLWQSDGRTPEATVAARLYTDIKNYGERSRFVQTGKNTFSLNPNIEREPEAVPAGATASTPAAQSAPDDVTVAPPAALATATGPAPGMKKRLSFTDAAEDVLHRYGHGTPMHYRAITAKVLEEDLVKTSGKTPEATLYAQVIQENARAEKRGKQPRFVQHGKGMIGLAEWLEPGVQRNISRHNAEAEDEMLRQLREMDPADFEQLIGQLLRALGIRDVEVTQYQGDRGIDATAWPTSRLGWLSR
jgi:restriction system protein